MKKTNKILAIFLLLTMLMTALPLNVWATSTKETTEDEAVLDYGIVHLDCGRKYFGVESIKDIINATKEAGMNYVQLAIGNDGMRFLLDDMALTVNGTAYTSDAVKAAVHAGNEAYYNFTVDELTEADMDEIIAYAKEVGVGIIPLINTPGHMDAILDAGEALTHQTLSYYGSARTIDVANTTAVAFTQAFVSLYVDYFSEKGCTVFNMGADEYANDKYTSGGMGFGQLQTTHQYGLFVEYVNELAAIIKDAGMTPMAFNDGIYYGDNTSYKFDTDIVIQYWSSGWSGYNVASASLIEEQGHKLINANGDYYWVLGKTDWQCSTSKASGFKYQSFQSGTIDTPVGAAFLIWSDYPGNDTEANVVSATVPVIKAFGKTLPTVKDAVWVTSSIETPAIPDVGTNSGSSATTATDSATNVSVTANGVESITASVVETPAVRGGVAYDITVNGGAYTGAATVSIPVPAEWNTSLIRGYVVESDGTVTRGITGTYADGEFTFDTPHFSEVGLAMEENITVSMGGTVTVEVDGNVTADVGTVTDTSIANVSVKFVEAQAGENKLTKVTSIQNNVQYYISDGNGNYLRLTGSGNSTTLSNTTNRDEATLWTFTSNNNGYRISATSASSTTSRYLRYNDGLTTTAQSSSAMDWSYSSNAGLNFTQSSWWSSTTYYIRTNNSGSWEASITNSNNGAPYELTETGPVAAHTEITFTGKTAGTTSVVIGDVTYNITVTEEAPYNAKTGNLTVEYWITNVQVEVENQTSKTFGTNDAASILNTLASKTGTSSYGTMYYWQLVVLDSQNKQTTAGGDDETADGKVVTALRYSGAWQYQTADGSWHWILSSDQVVAYYLQHVNVTTEVDTYFKDWGYSIPPSESPKDGQVALVVGVVYEDGSLSPEEDQLLTKATIFNYWNNRNIGIVAPTVNEDYIISKITYTRGTKNGNTDDWTTNTTVTWDKEVIAGGAGGVEQVTWFDETEVWNDTMGTTPQANGTTDNIVWPSKNTAILVLIYVKAVPKEDNLKVVYWDTHEDKEITSYNIAVSPNVNFKQNLRNVTSLDLNGTFVLPDNAFIYNIKNIAQRFNKELPQLALTMDSTYRSGLFRYLNSTISEDGKTLYLYYELKQDVTTNPDYIIDFGHSFTFQLDELLYTQFTEGDLADYILNAEIVSATFGTAKYNVDPDNAATDIEDNESITYTPDTVLTDRAVITLKITTKHNSTPETFYYVGIYPATTVYYEEGFVTFGKGWDVAEGDSWTGAGMGTGEQEEHPAQSPTHTFDNYGYDGVYANNTGASNGTSATTSTAGDSFKFEFTGTGFDLFTTNTATSGNIGVRIAKEDGTIVKMYVISTKQNGAYAENGYPETAYGSPIVSVKDLEHGKYVVTAYVASGTINFDGIRIYNTINATEIENETVYKYYKADLEENPSFYELRDVVITGIGLPDGMTADELADQVYSAITDGEVTAETGAIVFGEGDSVAELLEQGPKNELYLKPGQSVTFKLTTSRQAQVGLRLIGATGNVTVGSTSVSVSSVDMFYDLQAKGTSVNTVYTITNPSSNTAVLSITNIKVSDCVESPFASLTVEDIEEALVAIGVPESFEPEISMRWLSSTIRTGYTGTLTITTSTDVDKLIVNGKKLSGYTFRGTKIWTFTVRNYEVGTYTYDVVAVNADGIESEVIETPALKVNRSILQTIFERWF